MITCYCNIVISQNDKKSDQKNETTDAIKLTNKEDNTETRIIKNRASIFFKLKDSDYKAFKKKRMTKISGGSITFSNEQVVDFSNLKKIRKITSGHVAARALGIGGILLVSVLVNSSRPIPGPFSSPSPPPGTYIGGGVYINFAVLFIDLLFLTPWFVPGKSYDMENEWDITRTTVD